MAQCSYAKCHYAVGFMLIVVYNPFMQSAVAPYAASRSAECRYAKSHGAFLW